MPSPDIPKVEQIIVEMTNSVRKQHKLGDVKPDPKLTATARTYARFLAQSQMFSHTADGRQPSDRAKAAGYEPCFVSENLSSNLDTRGFETRQLARDAVQGWMNSPGHRKNMLTEHVVDIGVAVAKVTSQEKYISVQVFGRPYAMAYSFRIENGAAQTVHYDFLDQAHEIGARYMSEHTACLPGEITFRPLAKASAVIGRYQARDGDTFVLRRSEKGGVVVDVKPSEKKASR